MSGIFRQSLLGISSSSLIFFIKSDTLVTGTFFDGFFSANCLGLPSLVAKFPPLIGFINIYFLKKELSYPIAICGICQVVARLKAIKKDKNR